MKTRPLFLSGQIALLICLLLAVSTVTAQSKSGDPAQLKEKFNAALKLISERHKKSIRELNAQYIQGLKRLEKKLQSEGKLDALVEVTNERVLFEKSGAVSTSQLKEIKGFRQKLADARKPIDARKKSETTKLVKAYVRLLEPLQVSLTKSGDIVAALTTKKEINRARALLDLKVISAPAVTGKISNLQSFEEIPTFNPPMASNKIFEEEKWPKKVTIPKGKYTIRKDVEEAREVGREILISAGTEIRGSTRDVVWNVGPASVVGEKVNFSRLNLIGGLSARFYFDDCSFSEVLMGKGGAWGAKGLQTRWQFRNCKITGSLFGEWNSKKIGIQMSNCQLEKVEFPSIQYESGFTPSDVVGGRWGVIQDSYFRKCTIPVSVLSLMNNCSFEDCRFVDDPTPPTFSRPVKIVIFVRDAKWMIKNLPENLSIERKPLVH